jgi:hypothetical protein
MRSDEIEDETRLLITKSISNIAAAKSGNQKHIVQRAAAASASDRPRSVIVCLSVTVDLPLDLFDAEASPACNSKSQTPQNSMKITNYMPSMPSINASTANSVYRLTLFAPSEKIVKTSAGPNRWESGQRMERLHSKALCRPPRLFYLVSFVCL